MEQQPFLSVSPEFLAKVAAFVAVQVLVYLILSKSSGIFSANARIGRAFSFRPSCSRSIRRMLAAISYLSDAGVDDDRRD
ncbi:hypothetical protein AXF42_Ash006833 [Apostasia shenzhenica]|uniref:Uncharacterized protein n=1 Tax=Apostasia shenzhenica TaxID=1088818 RepID=A0A2I0AJC2_9ASPA|nr:hypothetical protein AXF42_Ash006833 [Apostasia shenzhenica]